MQYINYDDFKKIDVRVGQIIKAELAPKSERLVICTVQFGKKEIEGEEGEYETRQIVSGINQYIDSIDEIIGKKVLYVYNLEPKMIMGIESQGMLFAVGDDKETFSFMIPEKDAIEVGVRVH